MSGPQLDCVVSVSGFRGVVGATMTPAVAMHLAAAYGERIAKRGPVVVGRDSRPTGALMYQAIAAGLRGVGCDVIDIGVVPTPTVPIALRYLKASGGIQISASHNDVTWNALKCFSKQGRNINDVQLAQLLQAYQRPPRWQAWDSVGSEGQWSDAIDEHIDRVLAAVDVNIIAEKKFTVLIDSVNGSGSRIAPELLDALGCRVVPLYTNAERIFPRDPEPTAANVRETGAVVKAVGAHIGFVQDPDADRLAIIDEKGRYIGEEYTLVLCAAARMAAEIAAGRNNPVACTNLSTSRMLDDVAQRFGGTVVRASVGEAHVVDAMQKHGAVIGGEGNGGIIDPRVVWGRDSQTDIALVLEYLARSGKSLSALIGEIPSYAMHKEKIPVSRADLAAQFTRLRDAAFTAGASLDERDGLKWTWPDRWVHVRASGTEPASRIISEAPTAREAKDLAAAVRLTLGVAASAAH